MKTGSISVNLYEELELNTPATIFNSDILIDCETIGTGTITFCALPIQTLNCSTTAVTSKQIFRYKTRDLQSNSIYTTAPAQSLKIEWLPVFAFIKYSDGTYKYLTNYVFYTAGKEMYGDTTTLIGYTKNYAVKNIYPLFGFSPPFHYSTSGILLPSTTSNGSSSTSKQNRKYVGRKGGGGGTPPDTYYAPGYNGTPIYVHFSSNTGYYKVTLYFSYYSKPTSGYDVCRNSGYFWGYSGFGNEYNSIYYFGGTPENMFGSDATQVMPTIGGQMLIKVSER